MTVLEPFGAEGAATEGFAWNWTAKEFIVQTGRMDSYQSPGPGSIHPQTLLQLRNEKPELLMVVCNLSFFFGTGKQKQWLSS